MGKTKSARKPAPKRKPKAAAQPQESPPLRLEWRSPSELSENPKNWRRHPESQLAALGDVISEVGWAGACLFNERTGRLIDGHARQKVAIANGAAKVPVLVGSWSEEQEKKILATLDPLAGMAEADPAALAALLEEIETESAAVQALLDSLEDENPVPIEAGGGGDEFDVTPEEGPTRTKPGDLWLIGGKHRLLVGDCTDAANVARLMEGEKVGLCFTSPPYAQQRDYGEAAKEKVQDWYALMCGAFANLPMEDAGQVLVNLGLIHRDGEWVPYWDEWIEWMRKQGWRRFGWYVWDQGRGLPGDWSGRLAPSHEFIFHFNQESVDPEKHIECNQERAERERKQIARGHIKTGLRSKDGSVDVLTSPDKVGQTHKIPDSVFRFERHMANDIARRNHPATYPIGIVEHAIQTWPADIYDPFLGSGTTLIAAHRLGRTCYGCELEPRYADVILRRATAENLSVEKVG